MNFADIRRLLLVVFIGFLVLTAAVAIVTVLTGDFGTLQLKVLGTTLTISAASIAAMSCAALIERRRLTALGSIGVLLCIAAAGLLIYGIWADPKVEGYWKSTVTAIVLAVGTAHAFLLWLPTLAPRHRWVQIASTVVDGVLVGMFLIEFWMEIFEDGYYRGMIVVAIIAGLFTLVVPILMKLGGGANDVRRPGLQLEHVQADLYRDPSGRTYRVQPIER